MDGVFLGVLIFGPAVLGIVSLVFAIKLLQRPKEQPTHTTARTVFGVLALLAALGIGACYALMFVGGGIR